MIRVGSTDLFDTGMVKSNPKSSLDMQMQSYKFSRYTAGLGSQRTCSFPLVAREHPIAGTKTSLTVISCRRKQLDYSYKAPGFLCSTRSE